MSELEKCMSALESIGKSMIVKSATYPNQKVARARRICKAIETPAGAVLAERILQLQRQATLRPLAKAYGLGLEEEDADEDDAEDELRSELRQLQNREREITARLSALHFGGR
jgi:hypothetical protein